MIPDSKYNLTGTPAPAVIHLHNDGLTLKRVNVYNF